MPKKLYYHKTNGGAEYLTDTHKHGEGTFTDKTTVIVRLDGRPEMTGKLIADRAQLLEALKKLLRYADLHHDRKDEASENALMMTANEARAAIKAME